MVYGFRCFAAALAKYQTRSLIVLYDTIGTLADNAGSCLAQPELLSVLMPPLMQRWNQVNNLGCAVVCVCVEAL